MALSRAKLTNGVTTVEFDVITSEIISRNATITDKTVENGSVISDHVQGRGRS